jgi:thiol-disulfide isomerase/thioredoxin
LIRLLAVALVLLAALSAPASARLAVGAVPPDYLGKTPGKDEVRLSQTPGKIVIVTFWASWCGPCRQELPALDALQKVAGDRARIIAVNVKDSPQDYKAIRRQMKDAALTFTWDRDGKIAESYDVKGYPNLFVIDKAGKIAKVHVGFGADSIERIVNDVNALLVQDAAAPGPVAAN